MNQTDLAAIAFVYLFIQAIAFYATQKVLGNEVSKKSIGLISFGCLLSLWPTIYLAVILQSILIWVAAYSTIVFLIVFYLRKLSNNNISIKQAILIYGGIIVKLIIVSVGIVFLMKIITLLVLSVGSAF